MESEISFPYHMKLKVFTLNCWGIPWNIPTISSPHRKQRFEAIADFILGEQYNFVFLQVECLSWQTFQWRTGNIKSCICRKFGMKLTIHFCKLNYQKCCHTVNISNLESLELELSFFPPNMFRCDIVSDKIHFPQYYEFGTPGSCTMYRVSHV